MAGRVVIWPTPLGGKALLLFGGFEVAFLATRYSNLFFLLLAFSGVLGVLGLLWTRRNLLQIERIDVLVAAAPANTERTVEVDVRLAARPSHRFDLNMHLPLAGDHVCVATIAHASIAARSTGILTAQPRGIAAGEYVRVTSRYPFGLFEARSDVPCTFEVVSYPEPATAKLCQGHSDGDTHAAEGPRGRQVAGLREFRDGDALRDVHWKASARRGAMIVKECEPEQAATLTVVVDRQSGAAALDRDLARAAHAVLHDSERRPVLVQSHGTKLLVEKCS